MRALNTPFVVDVAIAGGGIIGLSLGLELRQRGLSVVVMERYQAMSSASWAAGGMLAVYDPQNPPELLPLSVHSWALYPAYLDRIEELSGLRVPPRTRRTLQYLEPERESGGIATAVEIAEFAPGLNATGHSLNGWKRAVSIRTTSARLCQQPSAQPRERCSKGLRC